MRFWVERETGWWSSLSLLRIMLVDESCGGHTDTCTYVCCVLVHGFLESNSRSIVLDSLS